MSLAKHTGSGWVSESLPPSCHQEAGTDLGSWDHLQRDRGITEQTLAMPWTLQHPVPHIRCTDSCSGGLGSAPSFILKWELKATCEQPALMPGGLAPCGGPLLRPWEDCVLAISPPTTSTSGDISTQSYLQTRETALHCCLLISRNSSIPPGPLKNLP